MDNSDEFFSIKHAVAINVIPLEVGKPLPDEQAFEQEIPAPFLIASEHASIEATSLRNIRSLSDNNQELVNFLSLQSKKIDMLMGYLLALQDDPSLRHTSIEFGASGLTYITTKAPVVGAILQLKLFLQEESSAVYCYGLVESVEPTSDNHSLVKVRYNRIRQQDREILVRATLHLQSVQLKKRSEQLLEQSRQQ